MRFWIVFSYALFLTCKLAPIDAQAAKHALIIGNGKYENLEDLRNTHADAEAYHRVLLELGFKSTLHIDLTLDQTLDALDVLLGKLNPGDQVAFVYSGHGWSDGTTNFLSPTDAVSSGSDRKLKRGSITLTNGNDGVLDELQKAGVSLTFAVIDACRDNPFTPRAGTRSAGMSRGLARIDEQQSSFVIFSAGAGQKALDRLPSDDANVKLSVFSRHFIPKLRASMFLEDAISEAQEETHNLAKTYDGHIQTPIYVDGTIGRTCLSGDCQQFGSLPKDRTNNDAPNTTVRAGLNTNTNQQASLSTPSNPAYRPKPNVSHMACSQIHPKLVGGRLCVSSVLNPQYGNRYGAENLLDSRATTAWVEGKNGDGIGESLIISFDSPTLVNQITIRNGYNKSRDLYRKNGRIRELLVETSDGAIQRVQVGDFGDWQSFTMPSDKKQTWIRLTIQGVYRGYKYRDTAITELRLSQ